MKIWKTGVLAAAINLSANANAVLFWHSDTVSGRRRSALVFF